MKVERIDHVHVYVKNVDKAVELFGPLLGKDFYPVVEVPEFGARVALNPLHLEFIQPTDPKGITAKALGTSGSWEEGGICISLKVPNIEKATAQMESKGIKVLASMQVGKLKEVAFDSAKTFGVMIELCEYPGDDITLASMG
jgi:predicted enzyme related to lactoylglutathione lyase